MCKSDLRHGEEIGTGTSVGAGFLDSSSGGPDSSSIRAAPAARGSDETSCGGATPMASYRGHPSSSPSPHTLRSAPRGVTLIELLVVVTILMIIAAATVPRLRPAMDNQRMREASRSLHLYLSSARNLAMAEGRPCGIKIERLVSHVGTGTVSIEYRCATTVSQVQTPPPYGGDFANSSLRLQYFEEFTDGNGVRHVYFVARPLPGDISSLGGVRFHDMIQLNGQGLMYQVMNPTDTNDLPTSPAPPWMPTTPRAATAATIPNDFNLIDCSGDTTVADDGYLFNTQLLLRVDLLNGRALPPWPRQATPAAPTNTINNREWSTPIAFSVSRQPMKTGAAPLQLPAPAVIDLSLSGLDYLRPSAVADVPASVRPFCWGYGLNSVIIMFSASGALDQVYFDQWVSAGPTTRWTSLRVTQPVLLQIGKRENIVASSDPTNWRYAYATESDANLDDMTALIVAVNARTGLITTTDMASSDVTPASETDSPTKELRQFQRLHDCRKFGRQSDSTGGR